MENVVHRQCEDQHCNKRPSFNHPGQTTARFCFDHKEDGMKNVVTPLCDEGCGTHVSARGNVCLPCILGTRGQKRQTRNNKTKELAVVRFILEKVWSKELSWSCDVRIPGGASLYRPDLCTILDFLCLILEVDEDQHNRRLDEDEKKRVVALSEDTGRLPMKVLRFNPDGLWGSQSCWKMDPNTGILQLTPDTYWESRLDTLADTIKQIVEAPSASYRGVELGEGDILVQYLFFDNKTAEHYSSAEGKWHSLSAEGSWTTQACMTQYITQLPTTEVWEVFV